MLIFISLLPFVCLSQTYDVKEMNGPGQRTFVPVDGSIILTDSVVVIHVLQGALSRYNVKINKATAKRMISTLGAEVIYELDIIGEFSVVTLQEYTTMEGQKAVITHARRVYRDKTEITTYYCDKLKTK
jgi:hypothetical protein